MYPKIWTNNHQRQRRPTSNPISPPFIQIRGRWLFRRAPLSPAWGITISSYYSRLGSGLAAVSGTHGRWRCSHLHVKASIRTYCVASGAIIDCGKGKGNSFGGEGGVSAGDFFSWFCIESQPADFTQQTEYNIMFWDTERSRTLAENTLADATETAFTERDVKWDWARSPAQMLVFSHTDMLLKWRRASSPPSKYNAKKIFFDDKLQVKLRKNVFCKTNVESQWCKQMWKKTKCSH